LITIYFSFSDGSLAQLIYNFASITIFW